MPGSPAVSTAGGAVHLQFKCYISTAACCTEGIHMGTAQWLTRPRFTVGDWIIEGRITRSGETPKFPGYLFQRFTCKQALRMRSTASSTAAFMNS
jgi:hypothetical protein